MAITDFITFFLSMYFWVRGSSRGILLSLINPFSIIATTILSIIYYQKHPKDWVISLCIGVIGPFILNFLLKFFIISMAKATNTDVQPGFFSRLAGSIFTLAWGWIFIIITLILLALLPAMFGKTWTFVHNDVTKSMSYNRVAKPLQKDIFKLLTAGDPFLKNKVTALFTPTAKQTEPIVIRTMSNSDANSLAQDPRFQKILQDPEVRKDIDAHDFVKLMGNPKVIALTQQIMSDPATLQKVLAIYNNQAKQQTPPPAPSNASN